MIYGRLLRRTLFVDPQRTTGGHVAVWFEPGTILTMEDRLPHGFRHVRVMERPYFWAGFIASNEIEAISALEILAIAHAL